MLFKLSTVSGFMKSMVNGDLGDKLESGVLRWEKRVDRRRSRGEGLFGGA